MAIGLVNKIRSLPMGLKVSMTLWLVVLGTAGVLSVVQYVLADRYLEQQANRKLQGYIQAADAWVEVVGKPYKDPRQALGNLYLQMRNSLNLDPGIVLYGIIPPAKLVRAEGGPKPPALSLAQRQRILELGVGHLRIDIKGREHWIYFSTMGSGRMVFVLQAPRDVLVGDAVNAMFYWTWAAAVGLCALLTGIAVMLARHELAWPLERLTEQGERMAGGDLTPPPPLEGRDDELGRLSRVLHQLAVTANGMVETAQRNQARFEQLFTESRDAAFLIGANGHFELVNPTAVKTFGFETAEQMQKLKGTEVLFVDARQRRAYLETLNNQGYVQDYPVRMRRPDGGEYDAQITATVGADGRSRFGLLRDVTKWRIAQRALKESEERHRRLLENAPDMIFRWSVKDQNFDYISPVVREITGYTAHEIMDRPELLQNCVHPEWRDQVFAQRSKLNHGRVASAFEMDFKLVHRTGEVRWLRERSVLVRDENGHPLAVEGIATDVTESKRLEQALIQGRRMVESVLQSLPAAVMVIDRDHEVVHWNRAMARLTGIDGSRRVGTNLQWNPFFDEPRPTLADLVLEGDCAAMEQQFGGQNLKRSSLVEGGVECEAGFEDPDGQKRTLYVMAAPIKDEDGKVVRAVETHIDLSEKRELEEELTRLSVTDELTGLHNQRFFYATLTREVETARRYNQPLALLLLDLDHFKQYNDRFGHLEGDRVLSACAKLIQGAVRLTDLACRYGGEEFVVLLPYTGMERAVMVAERIRSGIEAQEFFPVLPGKGVRKSRITVSVGVAVYEEGWSNRNLVRMADLAMYEAKHAGRNQVAVYEQSGEIRILSGAKDELAALSSRAQDSGS